MTHRVEFTSAAARQVKKLPRSVRTRLLDAIEDLSENPWPPGAKKLTGEQYAWRIRVGDHSVLYEVLDAELVVLVVGASAEWSLGDAQLFRRSMVST